MGDPAGGGVAPSRFDGRSPPKLVLVLNAAEMVDTESQETYAEWSWPLWLGGWIGHFGVLVPLAMFGGWMLWPERRRLSIFYLMTAIYSASLLLFYVFALPVLLAKLSSDACSRV